MAASRDHPGLYRTKDLGKKWELLTSKGKEHFGGYFHPAHPGWIYLTLTEDAQESGLYFSKDDGFADSLRNRGAHLEQSQEVGPSATRPRIRD